MEQRKTSFPFALRVRVRAPFLFDKKEIFLLYSFFSSLFLLCVVWCVVRCAKGCVQGCYGVVVKCLVFIAFGMCFGCVSCVCHTVPSGVPPVCAACVVTYRRHQPFEVAYLSQMGGGEQNIGGKPTL